MKKGTYFLVVVISFFLGFIICGDKSCAENKSITMTPGEKTHISLECVSSDAISVHFPDGKGTVRVNITNIVSSGTIEKFEDYKYVPYYVFNNDPSYNNLYINFVNVFLDDIVQKFEVGSGQTSISFDLELVRDYSENLTLYCLCPNDIRKYYISFDIEIQPTESWVSKEEEELSKQKEKEQQSEQKGKEQQSEQKEKEEKEEKKEKKEKRSELRGKILDQQCSYSRKCELEIEVKDDEWVRLYRKSSKKGKYKLVKQFKYEPCIVYDKGLKPNKQYWYKIQTRDWDKKLWSEKSSAKSFWTAPEKVKVKRSGNILRWNKPQGAVGYIVVESWHTKVGYNIFGQVLTDYFEKAYVIKGRAYSLKHNVDEYSVYAIAKHNGKYFANDYEGTMCKRMSGFNFTNSERYVG